MSKGDWLVQAVVSRHGSTLETIHLRGDKITIGRAPESDVVLDGDTVSRAHAIVSGDRNELVVRDAGSTNGVQVNDIRVRYQRLAPWDVVAIGEYEILFCVIASEAEIATDRDLLSA